MHATRSTHRAGVRRTACGSFHASAAAPCYNPMLPGGWRSQSPPERQRACRSARERQRRGRIAPAQSLLAQWEISNPTPLMIVTVHTGTRDSMYWYLTREEAEVPRRLTGRGYRHTGTRYGAVTNRLGSRRDNPRDTHKEHGISWDLSTCPLPQASSIGDVHVL